LDSLFPMAIPPPAGEFLTATPQAISPLCKEGSLEEALIWRRELYVTRTDCIESRATHGTVLAVVEATCVALEALNIRERDAAERVVEADKAFLFAWHTYHFLVRTTSHTHLR
jgi:hypothetical protein